MRFKKLGMAISVTLALLVAVVGGCAKPAPQKELPPIKVGVVSALSGPSAEMGIPLRDGIVLATEELNAAGGIGGRKVQLVIYDDEANPAKSTTVARRMCEIDEVVAVLGSPNTGTAIANTKVTEEYKVPHVHQVAQGDDVIQPGYAWTFRITNNITNDVERLVTYIKEKGYKQVGVVHDTLAYGLGAKPIIEETLKRHGLTQTGVEAYTAGTADMTPQALSLRKGNPEVVILWGIGADATVFVKSCRAIGWNVPMVAARGVAFEVFLRLGGKDVEGTVVAAAVQFDKPEAATFIKNYEARFGTTAGIDFAALGYDSAKILFEAMKKAGPEKAADRTAVRDALLTIDKYMTVTGPPGAFISFGPGRYEGTMGPQSATLQMVRDGKWVNVR